MFSLSRTNERSQEICPRASWLAWRVKFVTIKFDIKFFLQINILLRHVEEKMFSFLGSNERFHEIGQRASLLACKVDFFCR